MKIERIHIKNFRSLRCIELKDIPPLAVFIGKNGAGKSTLFRAFAFLQNCLKDDVSVALSKESVTDGFREVVSRGAGANEAITIEIQFRMEIVRIPRLVTYKLEIANDADGAYVAREILRYKRGRHGSPYHFLDFKRGKGYAITNEERFNVPDSELTKEKQQTQPDALAIKGLGQFERFKAAAAFRHLIENWHVSDFHITHARGSAEAGLAKHLSGKGDNLPLVVQYLQKNHKEKFDLIIERFRERIPGMQSVASNEAGNGEVFLTFSDSEFEKPFIARYVSDGTIKMFAYLVLLNDPDPHPFLCVEEPENQLYPKLMGILAEELRHYAVPGRQVFVSTHSPDLVNALRSDEVFITDKVNGETRIFRAADNEQIRKLVDEGDQLGWLWMQELLETAARAEHAL